MGIPIFFIPREFDWFRKKKLSHRNPDCPSIIYIYIYIFAYFFKRKKEQYNIMARSSGVMTQPKLKGKLQYADLTVATRYRMS
jgi:hypothetical protein